MIDSVVGGPADLIDARFGVIVHLGEDPRRAMMPAGQRQWLAHVADAAAFGAPPVDRIAFGNSLDDAAAAAAAVGEAIERYCGNLVPARLLRATWTELAAAGEEAVDPDELALFSPEQLSSPGFPFVPFARDLTVRWVRGKRLPHGAPVWVPASLVHLNHRDDPPTNPLAYAGIAAGATPGEAIAGALLEVIERDATAIWWTTRGPSVRLLDGASVVGAFDDLRAEHRSVTLLAVPNELHVPVVAAFVEDHERELIGFGSACRLDARQAATKALTEAFGLLEVAGDLDDPCSPIWQAVAQRRFPSTLFTDHRPDRSYRDAHDPQFRSLVDLPGVAQLYLDPRMRSAPLDRLRRHEASTSFDLLDANAPDDAPDDAPEDVTALIDRVRQAGLQVVAVDLTSADVAACGLHVARVVVPGAYGNSPPAFPYRGGARLHSVPARLGWDPPPQPELHPIPLA